MRRMKNTHIQIAIMKMKTTDNRILIAAIQLEIKKEHCFVEGGNEFNGCVAVIHGFSIDSYTETLMPPCLNVSGIWSSELGIAGKDQEYPDGITEKPFQAENNEFYATILSDEVQDIKIECPIKVKSL